MTKEKLTHQNKIMQYFWMLQKYRKYKSKLMNRVETYRPNKKK